MNTLLYGIQSAGRNFEISGNFTRSRELHYHGVLIVRTTCGCVEDVYDVYLGPQDGIWIYQAKELVYELCVLPTSGEILETVAERFELDRSILDRILAALALFLYRFQEDIDLAIAILPIYTQLKDRYEPPALGGLYTNSWKYRFTTSECHWTVTLTAPAQKSSRPPLALAS